MNGVFNTEYRMRNVTCPRICLGIWFIGFLLLFVLSNCFAPQPITEIRERPSTPSAVGYYSYVCGHMDLFQKDRFYIPCWCAILCFRADEDYRKHVWQWRMEFDNNPYRGQKIMFFYSEQNHFDFFSYSGSCSETNPFAGSSIRVQMIWDDGIVSDWTDGWIPSKTIEGRIYNPPLYDCNTLLGEI
jgi:hypothetical protein